MANIRNPFTLVDGINIPKKILLPFLPTYVQHRVAGTEEMARRLHSTSALDGLRGIAALFVFLFHIGFAFKEFVEYGYGQSEENMRIIQLPFLSLFYRGHGMVAVFFVVGGYVLSLKPLALIHCHRPADAHSALVSSVFRRGIRLYLPAIAVTFITMLTIFAGLWEYPRQFITEDKRYIYYSDMHPSPHSTFYEQFWDWLYATRGLTDVFNYYNKGGFMMPYYNHYDPHLWTVPFEYRSSLVVTMVILALSRCTTFARLFLIYLCIIFCGMWDRWELVCFLSGLFVCDIDMTVRPKTLDSMYSHCLESSSSSSSASDNGDFEEKLPDYSTMCPLTPKQRLHRVLRKATSLLRYPLKSQSQKRWFILFIVGLYLLSTPNFQIDHTPGYQWLFSHLTPSTYTDSKRFLQSLGALLVTWSIANSSTLQKPFNTSFAQYLGRISYSLYVVHGPLIHIVGFSVTPYIWIHVTGMEGIWYWIGLGISTAILGVCVAFAADLFYRAVDMRAVRIARWFEDLCFVRE
jgi:peptidoglycan/LPS O-acetylase OafA/YrhL